jgi:Calcineurin-like phosphoesterase
MTKRKLPLVIGLISLSLIFFGCESESPEPPAMVSRFVVCGDSRGLNTGVNTAILGEIIQATLHEKAEFLLFTGDLIYGYANPDTLLAQLTVFREIAQPLYDAGIGVYPCRGNHDAADDSHDAQAWNTVFSGPYDLPQNGPEGEEGITYSFTHNNILVVALDNNVLPSRLNQAWLDTQFESNTKPHVFVFGHEPAFKVRHTDCLDDHVTERDTFWQSLKNHGVRTYFAGHDHLYDHCRLDDGDGNPGNDLHQFVVGTAGAPLYDSGVYDGDNSSWTPERMFFDKSYGYVVAVVEGPNVTLTWKRRTGPGVFEVAEEFTYSSPRN